MESDVNAFFDVFTIDFGINCLSSVSLEKKLIGLKTLSSSLLDTIRINSSGGGSHFNDRHISSQELLSKLREKNIIDMIFGNHTHVQIIQKSNDLLKCFLMGSFLSHNDLMKIWSLSFSNDIELRNNIYRLFQTNYYHFNGSLAEFFIGKILETKSQAISTLDIDLIIQLLRSVHTDKQNEVSKRIGENFLKLIFEDNLVGENIEVVMNEFVSLLKGYDMREQRLYFFDKLLNIFSSVKLN